MLRVALEEQAGLRKEVLEVCVSKELLEVCLV